MSMTGSFAYTELMWQSVSNGHCVDEIAHTYGKGRQSRISPSSDCTDHMPSSSYPTRRRLKLKARLQPSCLDLIQRVS